MHAQQAHLARSRKLDERPLSKVVPAQPPPHRERALWNFLTWSFFIAQVLAAEQFIGAQARASENLDLRSSDPNASTGTSQPESLISLESTARTSDDIRPSPGGNLDDLSFPSLKLGQFGGSVIDLDAVPVARVEDVSQSIFAAGYDADAGSSPIGNGPVDPLPDTHVHVVLPDILDVIGDVTGPLLDTVEDIIATLTGVVGGIADPLLGAVGGVVDAVDDVVHDVLAPVTDLVADLTQPLDDVLASAGQLTFPLLKLAGLDDLYNNGRYTDYGIELRTGTSPSSTGATGDIVASAANTITDVVDHVSDVVARPVDDVGRHLAHLLDDLGSRDGLL